MTEHHTICRACHAACGVIVAVENGTPMAVKGNPENPVYRGFCCVKGQNFAAQRNNPNRILHSQKRQPDGSYHDIPVAQAMDEIAERLLALRQQHGSRSIALYSGTFSAAASAANAAIDTAFMKALGSPMGFSSNTIDQPGKMVAAALFGRWMAPSTNFADARVIMLLGLNPLVAMSGGIPHTNPGRYLTDALSRGLKMIVVDPRRSETARRASLYLQVRPGHDVALLAAMLNVILDEELYDVEFVAAHMRGVEKLREVVSQFRPEEVAARADIAKEDLVAAARLFATNGPGVTTAGTGPNMSGHTTLLEYLVLCLNSVCGRWQRSGEQVRDPATLGQFVQPFAQAVPPYPAYAYGFGETMHARGIRNTAAGMPTGALADEILFDDERRVRALINHGGNPVAAWPDQLKTIDAMRKLELLVQLDVTMSATAREADYVIAVKHPLEMPGISLNHEYLSGYAPGFGTTQPWAQYTPAIVDAPASSDVLEDWEFFYGIAQRMGLELKLTPVSFTGTVKTRPWPMDMITPPTTEEIFRALTRETRIPLDEVMAQPAGAVFAEPAVIVAPRQEGWEGRLDAGNPQMLADLSAMVNAVDQPGDWPYRIVSRRQINVLNSSGHDIPGQHHGKTYNPAYMHPQDMEDLGLSSGDLVTLRSARASIPAVVEADHDLRRGLVSMSHSWGGGPDTDGDVRQLGACTGRLVADDVECENYTAMPRMSNIPIAVEARSNVASSLPR
jgi:anaerobic selenocysteine-containing dehydrogenase